jgi:recombination protein RecA
LLHNSVSGLLVWLVRVYCASALCGFVLFPLSQYGIAHLVDVVYLCVMFGNPETTTGGNALKFYASVRLDIRRVTTLKDGDTPIGNQVRVKIVKNKVAPPFRKAEFEITFGEGISHVGEIVDLGVELGIIKKSGSWFSYGESRLGQGRDAVKKIIKDNPELSEELEGKIAEALKARNEED